MVPRMILPPQPEASLQEAQLKVLNLEPGSFSERATKPSLGSYASTLGDYKKPGLWTQSWGYITCSTGLPTCHLKTMRRSLQTG